MAAMTSAQVSALADDSRCVQSCLPAGMQIAALIHILQQASGNTQTASELADSARCIQSCIPEGMQMAVVIYLLNQMIPNA